MISFVKFAICNAVQCKVIFATDNTNSDDKSGNKLLFAISFYVRFALHHVDKWKRFSYRTLQLPQHGDEIYYSRCRVGRFANSLKDRVVIN